MNKEQASSHVSGMRQSLEATLSDIIRVHYNSQIELGMLLGVSQATISSIKHRRGKVSLDKLIEIALVLNVSISFTHQRR